MSNRINPDQPPPPPKSGTEIMGSDASGMAEILRRFDEATQDPNARGFLIMGAPGGVVQIAALRPIQEIPLAVAKHLMGVLGRVINDVEKMG